MSSDTPHRLTKKSAAVAKISNLEIQGKEAPEERKGRLVTNLSEIFHGHFAAYRADLEAYISKLSEEEVKITLEGLHENIAENSHPRGIPEGISDLAEGLLEKILAGNFHRGDDLPEPADWLQ
jgi:hypothetical protein